MISRVPTSTLYSRLQHGLGASLTQVQKLQGQVGTGQKILKLSDDPVGAATGLRLRAQETDWAAYQRTADDATTSLGIADGALQVASSMLRRAKELAIGAVNGAHGQTARDAVAEEIASLRDQLADVANTQHLGRAVFGGHQPVAVAEDGDGVVQWSGDAGVVRRQVSPSVTLEVNLDGKAVFGFAADGAVGHDVFTVLADLETAVRTADTAGARTAQGRLDARADAVATALGQVGALANRVTAATELGRSMLEQMRAQRSSVEDVDLAEAVMRLSAATTGYQAALAAVARADLPSLANFLR